RIGWIRAFSVIRARRNRDYERIRKAWRWCPILTILSRNSGAVIDDEYRAPVGARHAPWIDNVPISEFSNAIDIRLEVHPVEATGSRGVADNEKRCCSK